MKNIILSVDGMTCSACSSGLEKYLNKQNGIYNASVNLVLANASIQYDEKILKIQTIEEFIKKAGFKSLGEFKEIKIETNNKREKIKFILFTLLSIILLYISMGHMIGLPSFPYLDPHLNTYNYILTLLFLTIPFIFYGFDILKNGYKNLIHKTPNMDTLVGIGVITSFLYSLYNFYQILNGKNFEIMNLYFETSAIVIYFVKLGRFIEKISKNKTKEAIQKLVTLTPNKAVKKVGEKEIEITLDQIKKGDILICKPGEKIAVDGKLCSGSAHFDDSFITGESKPINKTKENTVFAGSLNYDGYVEYIADKIGKDSTISEIVRLVIEASNTKAPISKIADKVSGIFTPIVLLFAIFTFLIYLIIFKDISSALLSFITILVVACPCSLGLATPLAIVVSEGLCASNGILIKKSEILEIVPKINTIALDKTGTLTYGNLKISKIINYSNLNNNNLLQIVGSIESKSSHPIAKAFINYLENNKIKPLNVTNFENISGIGIKGKIGSDYYLIGNSKILKDISIENFNTKDEKALALEGNSIVYILKNKSLLGLIGVNDIIRENSINIIERLSKNNIETIMITGDNEQTAKNIGNKLGITKIISNVVPSEKSNIIKDLKKQNKIVMMCGDGINDSPALTVSDIGVSMQSGTDIAMDSSDVILTKNDLSSIIKLINISKKTIKIIKQNLFWAFFYNILMLPIAAGFFKKFGIYITPIIASLAMVFSSFTVILNTLRLKK